MYIAKTLCYEELLEQYESISIHHRNIQALATEMSQVKFGYTPKIFSYLFN